MTCDCANDGASALRLLRRAAAEGRPYALALVDRNMSGMHELELVHDMKQTPALAPCRSSSSPPRSPGARRCGAPASTVCWPSRSPTLGCATRSSASLARRRLCPAARPVLPAAGGRHRTGRLAAITCRRPVTRRSDGAPRVLLAEDNEINQMVAVNVLEKCGYRVDLAETGRQAVEMCRSERYQAIFMDCRLPELDGYSAASEIRRLEAPTVTRRSSPSPRTPCAATARSAWRRAWTSTSPSRCGAKRSNSSCAGRWHLTRSAPARIAVAACRRGTGAVVDTSLLDEIDQDSATRIVALFLIQLPRSPGRAGRCRGPQDTGAIRRLTHGLKGAAASVGAVAVCRACDGLSAAGTHGRCRARP